MKSLYIIGFLSMFSYNSNSQNLAWAKGIGGAGSDRGQNIFIDGNGNIYTTGAFTGTVDFDPGPGIYNLNGSLFSGDIFVSKLDGSGNFVWARAMGGANDDYGMGVAVDPLGNVYITGSFHATADFDPGPGVYNLTAPSSPDDMFICKLDSNGNFLWAKSAGNNYFDGGMSIVVDESGNSYTTGYFSLTVDFDPGPAVHNLTVFGSSFDNDVFVLKLDSGGNFVWVKQMGGTDSEYPNKMCLDANGNIYTTGFFTSTTADFDPGPLVYNLSLSGSFDIFVSKLDSAGNFIWAKKMAGTGEDNAKSIAVDVLGNVYTSGYFNGTADFDPGMGTFNMTSAGSNEIFVSKLDVAGNFLWAKRLGSTSSDWGNDIALDADANLYMTGYFMGTVDFDAGPGTFNLSAAGTNVNAYILKLDSGSNFVWAGSFGSANCTGYSLAADANASVFCTGNFQNSVDFDPGPGVFSMSSAGNGDVFIVKLTSSPVGTETFSYANDGIKIYPNPVSGTATLSFTLPKAQNCTFYIRDIMGRVVASIAEKNYAEGESAISWNSSDLKPGIYFFEMTAGNSSATKIISVVR